MTFNIRTNLRKSSLSQQGPGQVIEINQNPEIEPFPGTSEETRGFPVDDHPLYPPALRQMLEANDYQVALISRSEWNFLGRPETRVPVSPPVPAILLAFSWKELVDQVRELVRDSSTSAEGRIARFADFRVDFVSMKVTRLSGETIVLTQQEFKTLKCFLLSPERVLSRDELLNEAWGYQNYPSTRTVDNHVLKLRQKFERDPARPVHFRTVHGVGYQFVP
jgi:DNA-binding winged helix-turn-helix (wHTH) protein